MPPDEGHALTEQRLAELEKRVTAAYQDAYHDLENTVQAYFASFAQRDAEQMARLAAGEITEDYYQQWRLNQMGRGKRWEALRDQAAERMTRANETALAYVNDATPGIYALNRSYAIYELEKRLGSPTGIPLWDEQTVKRLIIEQPGLMPYYPPARAVQRGLDLAYGKKQITACVTSAILQGKSIKGVADALQSRITTMDRDSAIRTARTAVTGAQNAGRMDSYHAAEKLGIKVQKQWLATLDSRTRHSHAALDGQKVDNDQSFSNGCMFPGDPGGPPREIYNCRCTLIASLPDVDTSDAQRRARDPETGRSVLVNEMTYTEWNKWKQDLQQQAGAGIIRSKIERGELSTQLSHQQYLKHVVGTKQFELYQSTRKTPQSILLISEEEAQALINRVAGTGEIDITRTGEFRDLEYFYADQVIGQYFANDKYINTTRYAIHYGKKSSHIVPTPPRKEKTYD